MPKLRVRSCLFVSAPGAILLAGVLGSACSHPTFVDPPSQGSDCSQAGSVDVACKSTETVTTSAVRPAPLSGGTLLMAKDGVRALVADPDRDRILLVDTVQGTVLATLPTPAGAHPGRAVEDADGRFHVVLRDGGGVMTIVENVATATTPTCAAPRGIAFAAGQSSLYVACAGGELIRLQPAAAPTIEGVTMLGPDLRDVVASSTKLFVTHFRSAAVDLVGFDGTKLKTVSPAPEAPPDGEKKRSARTFTPDVAWRAIARPAGGVLVVHQQALSSELVLPPSGGPDGGQGGYSNPHGGDDCQSSAVHGMVTGFDDDGNLVESQHFGGMPLPVDLALSAQGTLASVVSAGRGRVQVGSLENLLTVDGCGSTLFPGPESPQVAVSSLNAPTPVAVAYDGADEVVTQLREPSMLEVHDSSGKVVRTISLNGDSRADTGYSLFQGDPDSPSGPDGNVSTNITCASCHPEGGDDGHVWSFDVGLRRTMSLAGNVTARAPFHWKGDLTDMGAIMDQIFTKRLGGAPQSTARVDAIKSYLATFPALPTVAGLDADAVGRGKALFESADTGCTTCHVGAQLTNRTIVDVGTGDKFKVPTLNGLGMRAPYLHDGSALTLVDRFGPQGGGDKHGHTSQLTTAEIADLSTYLSSL